MNYANQNKDTIFSLVLEEVIAVKSCFYHLSPVLGLSSDD